MSTLSNKKLPKMSTIVHLDKYSSKAWHMNNQRHVLICLISNWQPVVKLEKNPSLFYKH